MMAFWVGGEDRPGVDVISKGSEEKRSVFSIESERDGGRTSRKQILMGRIGRLEARVADALPDCDRQDGPA